MSIFTNKNSIKNKEILELLNKLEQAHKDQDALASSVLLTKLRQKNIKIVVDKSSKK